MRTLAKNPAFALTAVLSLALGIGANTAIYSVINALMLRTLPMKNPHGLAGLRIAGKDSGVAFTNPQWKPFAIRRMRCGCAGVRGRALRSFRGRREPACPWLWVSGGYFDVSACLRCAGGC